MANLRESLSYEPSELGFGTSGLRGLATDMTDLECYINTTGFLSFLEKDNQLEAGATVYLAGDLRYSTPRISIAVARAIEDKGYKAGYGGLIPTPAVALYGIKNAAASIMVTGSHIPADRNGIKFNKVGGEILKPDEVAVKEAVSVERARIYAEDFEGGAFNQDGSFVSGSYALPEIIPEIASEYIDRFTNVFTDQPFAGKKVVIYEHSAVGRDMLGELFRKLGADVVTTGRSDTFISIDTENVTAENQAYFRQLADENPGLFAIISTDGDSDRPFVVDENGLFHRGDELGAVVAKWLEADFAAVPISSSDAIDTFLDQLGVEYTHTRIGSPYVITAIADAEAAGKKRVVGWEVNGGFLLGVDVEINGKEMTRLPTRDAFFPIVCALALAHEKMSSLSEVFNQLPARFTQAGLIDNFAVETSKNILATLQEDSEENRAILGEYFTVENGFDKIVSTNSLDGIRMYFENGDIAHLRPSGNAPQMRIYSVGDTQERADEIVEFGLNSILPRLGERFAAQ